jgi:dimethylamine/trimethylamine dehydrogenase
MDKAALLESGYRHIILATGATWRRDGVGHNIYVPVAGMDAANVLSPDDIMAGKKVTGPVIVYDDDQYYMGAVIAEKLRAEGHDVTLVTPGTDVATWSVFTDEQFKTQAKLMKLGVKPVLTHRLAGWHGDHGTFACNYTGAEKRIEAATLVNVSARISNDALFLELKADKAARNEAGILTLKNIGDADVPGAIVHAVYAGHKAAREFGEAIDPDQFPFKRELVFVK